MSNENLGEFCDNVGLPVAIKLLGVDRDTLGKWRRGERKPNAAALRLIDVLLLAKEESPEFFEVVLKEYS